MEEEFFEFELSDLGTILGEIQKENKLLSNIDTYILVDKFKRDFRCQNLTTFTISVVKLHEWLNEIISDKVNMALLELANRGEIEVTFDDKVNEFKFRKLPKSDGNK